MEGNNVLLTCIPKTNSNPVTYAWLKDGASINAAFFAIYNRNPIAASDEGEYHCETEISVDGEAIAKSSNTITIEVESK